jgi:membrane protease YdiL (CAAX protease family)
MNTRLNTKRILIFLAFAFGITWTAQVTFHLTVGKDNPLVAGLLANYLVVIWAPGLAHVATRLITREGWRHLWLRPKFRRGWRFYLAAWLLPTLAVIVGAALYYLIFPESFDSNLSEARNQLAVLPFFATWVPAASPWAVFLALAMWIVVVLSPAYALVSLGEEFGWRAYLLPKLVEQFGGSADGPARSNGRYAAAARKAALLIGVIWGVWHVPSHLLGNPEPAIAPELLYIVSTCCMSVLLSWFTLRSGSVWPAAIGHGTGNNAQAFPKLSLKGTPNALLGPAGGLIGGIGYIALALVLLFSRRAFTGEQETRAESVPAAAIASPGQESILL